MVIKLKCSCGQKYAFEVEPVNGRMEATVACPACGADGTATANQVIAQNLAEQAQTMPSDVQSSSPGESAPMEVVQPLPAEPAPATPQAPAPTPAPAPAAPRATAAPVARKPQPPGPAARPPARPVQRPGTAASNRPASPVAAPAATAAPKGKLTKAQLWRIIAFTAIAVISSSAGRIAYKIYYVPKELQTALTIAQAEVTNAAAKFRNPFVRMEPATVGPGRKFTYNYTLLTKKKQDIDLDKWRKTTAADLKRSVKASREMRPLFQGGVTVCYRYKDKDGVLIDEIAISPSEVLK